MTLVALRFTRRYEYEGRILLARYKRHRSQEAVHDAIV